MVVYRGIDVRAVTFQYIDESGSQLQEFILYAGEDVALARPLLAEYAEDTTDLPVSIGDDRFAELLRRHGIQYAMRVPLLGAALRVTPLERTVEVARAISMLCGWEGSVETQTLQPNLRLA